MPRSYHQACGLALALDRIGERWTLLLVRNLLLGPQRYTDLQRGLPGIGTNLLAKRLQQMEAAGLVERIRTGPGEGGHAYRLTAAGQELEPAIHALGRWGGRWLALVRPGQHKSLEWLLVALRRRYRGGARLVAEVVADEVPYSFVLTPRLVRIGRGPAPDPVVRASGSGAVFAALFLDGWPAHGLPASIGVEGSPADLRALVEAFERTDG
jgi:DNA-binding HxlR family transcriptional regulator